MKTATKTKMEIKNNKGLSLIECMVVIVIIGITLLIFNFTSKGQIRNAAVNEGIALVKQVVAQERIYSAKHGGKFTAVTETNQNDDIMLNTHENKHFKKFIVTLDKKNSNILKVTALGSAEGDASGVSVIGTYNAISDTLTTSVSGL